MSKVRTQVLLERRQYDRLKELAFRRGRSLSGVLRDLLDRALWPGAAEPRAVGETRIGFPPAGAQVVPIADPVLAELVRRLVAAYEPERVYLFGSRARGEGGPDSDYDLLLVVPDQARPERTRSRLAYQALRGTGTAADVLVCTRGYFDNRRQLRTSLPATVLREGVLLHAA